MSTKKYVKLTISHIKAAAVAEPVEVTNVYDATQLKNAVDDELARVQ